MKDIFGVIEVGSSNTKGYVYINNKLKEIPFVNIQFRKNYKANKEIINEDKQKLFNYILKIKEIANDVYVYGTSIFRDLSDEEREKFITELKQATEVNFEVVTAEKENEYTVFGAISKVNHNGNVAVMISGGGSTEIAICNNGKVIEIANTSFGAGDITEKFGDISGQFATSNRDEVVNFIKRNLNLPTNKADVLILTGGNHILCYTTVGYPLEKNTLFEDERQPYMISAEKRAEYDLEFYYKINLDDMRKFTPDNPNWWNGTRAICSFSKCVGDVVGAKYIIPTSINMVYGIVEEIRKIKI